MAMALDYLTWWLMSPGVACFLLLNLLVAAIAVTSLSRRAQQDDEDASTRRRWLCRSASSMVLDRLRSFAKHPSVESSYYISPEAEELKQVIRAAPAHDDDRQFAVPQPAAMATISTTVSGNAKDETAASAVKSMSSDVNGTCALDREGHHAREPMPPPPPPPAAPAVAVVTAETARVAALVREAPKEELATVAEFVKRKHRRRDHVYAVELEGKAELNARAEQFIRQFRQELRLQRLDSMLSRHTNTLNNGSGAPTSR